jgi:hypothetical protein
MGKGTDGLIALPGAERGLTGAGAVSVLGRSGSPGVVFEMRTLDWLRCALKMGTTSSGTSTRFWRRRLGSWSGLSCWRISWSGRSTRVWSRSEESEKIPGGEALRSSPKVIRTVPWVSCGRIFVAGMPMRTPPDGGCLALSLRVSGSLRTTERKESWIRSLPAVAGEDESGTSSPGAFPAVGGGVTALGAAAGVRSGVADSGTS